MSATIEARIRQLLTADPVCQGQVSGTTVRALALEFAREPEPDSDVLAERAACTALMTAGRQRIERLFERMEDGAVLADLREAVLIEIRRAAEAETSITLGLHRNLQSEIKGA
jgi:hypothetical protein